jgi:hypothetical protein
MISGRATKCHKQDSRFSNLFLFLFIAIRSKGPFELVLGIGLPFALLLTAWWLLLLNSKSMML